MFQLCHQFAILNLFFQIFCFKFKLFFFFKCYISQVSKKSNFLSSSKHFIQFFGVLFFSDIPISLFILFSACLAFLAGFLVGPTLFKFRLKFS